MDNDKPSVRAAHHLAQKIVEGLVAEDSCALPSKSLIAAIIEEEMARPLVSPQPELTPLCPIHRKLDETGVLELGYGNSCVACSLNERQELLDLLAPLAPKDASEDSVTVLRKVIAFWDTHQGDSRVVVSYPAPQPDEQATDEVSLTNQDSGRCGK